MADPSYLCQQLFRSERLQEGQELVWCSKRFCRDVAAELCAGETNFLQGEAASVRFDGHMPACRRRLERRQRLP